MHEAARFADWVLRDIGRELRLARITAGMTQRQVAGAIGKSTSWVSRTERGRARAVAVRDLVRHSAAVGLKLYLTTYPGGRRPLDTAQLQLLAAFNARLNPRWTRTIEAVVPIEGDLRAADELIRIDGCTCSVEAITRFADAQKQIRSGRTKQRDLGADRLILLIKASHANRRVLREAGPILRDAFPVSTREAMAALTAGRDPRGDCLVLL